MNPNHSAEPIPGGRSGGSLGEVFCKHFPSRKPFVQRHSERFGEVGKSFPFFVFHPPSDIIHLTSSPTKVRVWRCEIPLTSYFLHLTSHRLAHLPLDGWSYTILSRGPPIPSYFQLLKSACVFSYYQFCVKNLAVCRNVLIFAENSYSYDKSD